jgi:hypothetical protein
MDEFKVGDRVVCVDDEGADGGLTRGERYTIDAVYLDLDDAMVRIGTAAWFTYRFTLAAPATADTALRFNGHKPESDYILTYEGGIRAAFGYTFHYVDTLQALTALSRSPDPMKCSTRYDARRVCAVSRSSCC